MTSKKVTFDLPESPKLDDKKYTLKLEIWRQDRKDKRAYLELISAVNVEITTLYGVSSNKRLNFFDSLKYSNVDKDIYKRLENASSRIKLYNNKIKLLNNRIQKIEDELLNQEI